MCSKCDYEIWIDKMEEMLEDSDYEFAEDTVTSILEWVQDNDHITENQIRAIKNIAGSI
jgi:dihydroneopterin aldolase